MPSTGAVGPDAIKDARRRLGLSQAAFAALVNARAPGLRTNTVAVCRWERGTHKPSGPAAWAINAIIDALPQSQ